MKKNPFEQKFYKNFRFSDKFQKLIFTFNFQTTIKGAKFDLFGI